MRVATLIAASVFSSFCWSAPITYLFSGVTTNIVINTGDYDPSAPLVGDDSSLITSGDVTMNGQIVFDPELFRSGAGGEGLGEVLSWEFNTQGLSYAGAGGAFHYLDFSDNALSYLDEVPTGGFGPDVVTLDFEFSGTPFSLGPADFPIADFLGGTFSTAIDLASVSDEVVLYGLEGEITDIQVAPGPTRDLVSVSGPSSLYLMLIGLLALSGWCARQSRRAN
ncbi:hypothetical protein [Marinobacter sp. F4216]|uniref:hypothetical protein n=1 Tax=Marinobacter sp. F4216 TaxID=2874281 RepID=UPI001CBBE9E0|nr:hypothetical protein [Marinobacter sp. F4216]MBZ2169939.1 hypothetical protein [Marinobacter sp. F4216]